MGSRKSRALRTRTARRPETTEEDKLLVRALLAKDERAYRKLTRQLYRSMLRVAAMYCPSEAVAQEVVQETWVAVLTGLDRFAFRSSLRTWIFRILANRARTRSARERRGVSLDKILAESGDGEFDPTRFEHRGSWAQAPREYDPEQTVNDIRFLERLSDELSELPENQRSVVMMRDVEGLNTIEVARALEISEVHVRVLLHRGRARLRLKLEPLTGAAVA